MKDFYSSLDGAFIFIFDMFNHTVEGFLLEFIPLRFHLPRVLDFDNELLYK